jgi:hypothetical protein
MVKTIVFWLLHAAPPTLTAPLMSEAGPPARGIFFT